MIVRDFDADDLDDEPWNEDPDEDDDQTTAPCPSCGESIYDDSERCPSCGRYLSREDDPTRKPWWLVLGVMACLGVVIWWILHP
jgi:predicted nucleic acid-binding Zn ribbon protein